MITLLQLAGVLIETLWNVKDDKFTLIKSLSSVLIETLWNVKSSHRIKFLVVFTY